MTNSLSTTPISFSSPVSSSIPVVVKIHGRFYEQIPATNTDRLLSLVKAVAGTVLTLGIGFLLWQKLYIYWHEAWNKTKVIKELEANDPRLQTIAHTVASSLSTSENTQPIVSSTPQHLQVAIARDPVQEQLESKRSEIKKLISHTTDLTSVIDQLSDSEFELVENTLSKFDDFYQQFNMNREMRGPFLLLNHDNRIMLTISVNTALGLDPIEGSVESLRVTKMNLDAWMQLIQGHIHHKYVSTGQVIGTNFKSFKNPDPYPMYQRMAILLPGYDGGIIAQSIAGT